MDNETTNQGTTPEPTSPTPTGGTVTGEPNRDDQGRFTGQGSTSWRAPENAAPYFRGKTAEEILAFAETYARDIESRAMSQSAPPPQPQHTPAPALNPDDYVTGRDVSQFASQWAQQSVTPQLEALANSAAQANLGIVRMQSEKDFQRWGPEIFQNLGSIPKAQWTVDNIRRIVQYVRAGHLDEIVREERAQLVAQGGPTMRSDGSAGGGRIPGQTNDPMAKAPDDWRKRATDAGLTPEAVRDFAAAQGMSVDEFFAQFGGKVVTEATR